MKPSWDDAPEWAQWLAMDASGLWWWFERKPRVKDESFWPSNGKFKMAEDATRWKGSIEHRHN